jgi:hypothetical protein
LFTDGTSGDGLQCCNSLWRPADEAFKAFGKCPSTANFTAFQKAEGKVCDYIQGVIDLEEAKEAAKPKLRHGDYGLWRRECSSKDAPLEFIAMQVGDKIHWFTSYHGNPHCTEGDCGPVNYSTLDDFVRLGNIFDDIAKRGEELERFKCNDHNGTSGFEVKISGMPGFIDIKTWHNENSGLGVFSPDQTQEICDNLQKVINYARNKK